MSWNRVKDLALVPMFTTAADRTEACLLGVAESQLLHLVDFGVKHLWDSRATAEMRRQHQICYDMLLDDQLVKIWGDRLEVEKTKLPTG